MESNVEMDRSHASFAVKSGTTTLERLQELCSKEQHSDDGENPSNIAKDNLATQLLWQ